MVRVVEKFLILNYEKIQSVKSKASSNVDWIFFNHYE